MVDSMAGSILLDVQRVGLMGSSRVLPILLVSLTVQRMGTTMDDSKRSAYLWVVKLAYVLECSLVYLWEY